MHLVTGWAQEGPLIQMSDLSKLYVIASRYEAQTKNLQAELSISQVSLTELGLKLSSYEQSATEYESRIISLSEELKGLEQARTDLAQSIVSSEASWTKYATESQGRIKSLEKTYSLCKCLLVISSVLAIAGWGSFGVSLLL